MLSPIFSMKQGSKKTGRSRSVTEFQPPTVSMSENIRTHYVWDWWTQPCYSESQSKSWTWSDCDPSGDWHLVTAIVTATDSDPNGDWVKVAFTQTTSWTKSTMRCFHGGKLFVSSFVVKPSMSVRWSCLVDEVHQLRKMADFFLEHMHPPKKVHANI